MCNLAVGQNEAGAIVSLNFTRGQACEIIILNASAVSDISSTQFKDITGPMTLFTGTINDFGTPDVAYGRLTYQVQVLGSLAWLASGTLQSSSVIPKSYLDSNVRYSDLAGSITGFALDETKASVDFGTEFIAALNRIANDKNWVQDSVTLAIQDTYGLSTNTKASEILGEIKTVTDSTIHLAFNLAADAIVSGLVTNLNTMFDGDWYYESFFNRITKTGELLWFQIVEHGNTIRLVAFTPFVPSTEVYTLYPSTYTRMNWQFDSQPFLNYNATVLTAGMNSNAQSVNDGLIVGTYKRPGEPLGLVWVQPAPEFMSSLSFNEYNDKNPNDPSIARNQTLGVECQSLGALVARSLLWQHNYQRRSVTLSFPFVRTDVSPLTNVKIDLLNTPDVTATTGTNSTTVTPAMYGSVMGVSIEIDATSGTVQTNYQVGYIRSFKQQEEIDTALTAVITDTAKDQHGHLLDTRDKNSVHPYFTSYYKGAKLDGSPRASSNSGTIQSGLQGQSNPNVTASSFGQFG